MKKITRSVVHSFYLLLTITLFTQACHPKTAKEEPIILESSTEIEMPKVPSEHVGKVQQIKMYKQTTYSPKYDKSNLEEIVRNVKKVLIYTLIKNPEGQTTDSIQGHELAMGATTKYQYNENGQYSKITQSNKVTDYYYNSNDLLIKEIESKTTVPFTIESITKHSYDSDIRSHVIKKSLADGTEITTQTYIKDPLGRLIQYTYHRHHDNIESNINYSYLTEDSRLISEEVESTKHYTITTKNSYDDHGTLQKKESFLKNGHKRLSQVHELRDTIYNEKGLPSQIRNIMNGLLTIDHYEYKYYQ